MRHYTTIAQSMMLLELGLSPESADMYWLRITGDSYDNYCNVIPLTEKLCKVCIEDDGDYHRTVFMEEDTLPCWSVGALLEVMPLYIEPTEDSIFTFSLWKTQIGEASVIYSNDDIDEVAVEFDSKNLIDACYEMVCWLLENGYIKKGE